jgi:hypothetical protein
VSFLMKPDHSQTTGNSLLSHQPHNHNHTHTHTHTTDSSEDTKRAQPETADASEPTEPGGSSRAARGCRAVSRDSNSP